MKYELLVNQSSKVAGVIIALAGMFVLSGWFFDITFLKSILPEYITMMPNTAVCFILAGASLFLQHKQSVQTKSLAAAHMQHNTKQLMAKGFACLILTISIITAIEYLFKINIGIDTVLFKEKIETIKTEYPGRMAIVTALNFTLTGIALLSLNFKHKFHIRIHELLSFLIFFICMPVFLGYLLNEETFYGIAKYYRPVAFHTAITFVITSIGLLFARPDKGVVAIALHEGAGGTTARMLFPAAILVPPSLAWLRWQGELHSLYSTSFGLVLFALSNMIIFVIIIWITANKIDKIDLKRKDAEEAEYAHRKLMEALIEFAPDPFIFVKNDGCIALVNKQAEECFGFSRYELIGQYVEMLVPENLRQSHIQYRNKYLANPLPRPMGIGLDVSAQRKNGEVFPIELSLSPVHTQNGILVACIVRDITERKKTEDAIDKQNLELQRSNAELERFAYVASHDLQEPLRMVAGYTQLLARRYKDKLDKDANEFINYAVDGATRMQKLINDLLTYSRLNTKLKSFEPVSVEDVLNDAVNNLKVMIEENKANVTHDPLPVVNADRTQILQLFQNLIANAIKFHSNELPHIHIKAQTKEKEWLFSFSDNGIGIESKYAERIFIIFQRLHTKEEYPGTGIGLAISKKIVERHGGKIWVESIPGKGSTFYFTINKMRG